MIKNSILLILVLYLLSLIQTSFLVHFNILGIVPNLILIAVILISLFTSYYWWGVSSAFVGGFFLDIFSGNFIGFHILILLGLVFFIQFILKKYVQPVIQLGVRLKKPNTP